jgi:hypothetical protein
VSTTKRSASRRRPEAAGTTGWLGRILPVTMSLLANGFVGYVMGVFAGAAAGNANEVEVFTKVLLPLWIGTFVLLAIFSYWLALAGRWLLGSLLPLLTVPLLIAILLVAV